MVSEQLLNYTVQKLNEYIAHLGEDYVTGGILYEAYPFEKTCSVPFDATAYGNRGRYYGAGIAIRYKGAQNDAWVQSWVRGFVAGAREIDAQVAIAAGKPVPPKTGYANLPPPDQTTGDAFQSNLPRLKEVKKKWDPHGRFNKWFNIATD